MRLPGALRSVALLEAGKGLLVLAAGLGLLSLLHHDVHALAVQLLRHTHLNPASHYPAIFVDAAARLTDARLWLYACGAAAYAGVRLLEAWGLWHARAWAEWLAAVSGGLYVPLELFELYKRPTWLGAAVLLLNLAVVAVMLQAVRRRATAQNGA